jgi:hypothetical protein
MLLKFPTYSGSDMTIQTDGPRFGAPVTITEIQATNGAHQHQVMVQAALVLAGIVVLIGLVVLAPRVWRRIRPMLAGPARPQI